MLLLDVSHANHFTFWTSESCQSAQLVGSHLTVEGQLVQFNLFNYAVQILDVVTDDRTVAFAECCFVACNIQKD